MLKYVIMYMGDYVDGLFDFEYDIGSIIREERKAQGLTMKELGGIIGVSEQAISQYELGKRAIKYEVLEKIAAAFGMSVPKLLDNYGLYDEYIPEQFNGDVDAYKDFKKTIKESAGNENKLRFYVEQILKEWGFKLKDKNNHKIIIAPDKTEFTISGADYDFLFYLTFLQNIKDFSVFQAIQILNKLSNKKDGEPHDNNPIPKQTDN